MSQKYSHTNEAEEALECMEALTTEALKMRGNGHAQRTALLRLPNFANKGRVGCLDWLEQYFFEKFERHQREALYCTGCKKTYPSLNAYNGHGPTKCRIEKAKETQNMNT